MDNVVGKMLEGRYLIEDLIGVGGMANVYKGIDTVEDRWVAVKMLRDEYADNEESLRRTDCRAHSRSVTGSTIPYRPSEQSSSASPGSSRYSV